MNTYRVEFVDQNGSRDIQYVRAESDEQAEEIARENLLKDGKLGKLVLVERKEVL